MREKKESLLIFYASFSFERPLFDCCLPILLDHHGSIFRLCLLDRSKRHDSHRYCFSLTFPISRRLSFWQSFFSTSFQSFLSASSQLAVGDRFSHMGFVREIAILEPQCNMLEMEVSGVNPKFVLLV